MKQTIEELTVKIKSISESTPILEISKEGILLDPENESHVDWFEGR